MADKRRWLVAALVTLAFLAYFPALGLPFVDDDDYVQIPLAGRLLETGFSGLWNYPDMRTRAVHMLLNGVLVQVFGFVPWPFYLVSVAIHAACAVLLFALLPRTGLVDEHGAFLAAAFFTIQEGHQEAVMWISARSEMLMFLFGLGAWLLWEKYLGNGRRSYYAMALAAFVLAGASKESFVIFPFLMALRAFAAQSDAERKRLLRTLAPFFVIATAYVVWSWATRIGSSGYSDDRFIVSARWPITLIRSAARLLFPWGIVAGAVLACRGKEGEWRRAAGALAFTALAILPYSFLTYMPAIASRHSYLASAGLAALIGIAGVCLRSANPAFFRVAAVAVLAINVEIIWLKKTAQFRERAQPYVMLRDEAAQAAGGAVSIHCLPFSAEVAQQVLAISGTTAEFTRDLRRDDHCFDVEYRGREGSLVRVNRRIRTGVHGAFY